MCVSVLLQQAEVLQPLNAAHRSLAALRCAGWQLDHLDTHSSLKAALPNGCRLDHYLNKSWRSPAADRLHEDDRHRRGLGCSSSGR